MHTAGDGPASALKSLRPCAMGALAWRSAHNAACARSSTTNPESFHDDQRNHPPMASQ
jgi:hypothetical protein